MFKKLSLFILLLLLAFSVFACKKGIDYSKISGEKPNQELKTGDYDLDFVVMHNFVIDYITSEVMPFFFVKDNSFDISGDKPMIELGKISRKSKTKYTTLDEEKLD